ncbi:MAG: phosphoribosylaminoimidazolesuccinocarboxamide synthase, partial [Verrucomicrobia bacterium]|nr:phosphoribosylaminoimidazolesuccinocarboxamide synthase [Verrucomicrobiota bacterium]
FTALLQGRSMLVRKTDPLPIEWVVRGYLAGSAWKEYQVSGSVSGFQLPANLRQATRLPEVILTPATKSEHGHDQNISLEDCRKLIGNHVTEQAREFSLEIYEQGSLFARERGIIIADTKFEFGMANGSVILIDECLTPDSSRFWPADQYAPGDSPPSFDKQIVRDYLERSGWNKIPPGPRLPDEILARTSLKYREALERLTFQ